MSKEATRHFWSWCLNVDISDVWPGAAVTGHLENSCTTECTATQKLSIMLLKESTAASCRTKSCTFQFKLASFLKQTRTIAPLATGPLFSRCFWNFSGTFFSEFFFWANFFRTNFSQGFFFGRIFFGQLLFGRIFYGQILSGKFFWANFFSGKYFSGKFFSAKFFWANFFPGEWKKTSGVHL